VIKREKYCGGVAGFGLAWRKTLIKAENLAAAFRRARPGSGCLAQNIDKS
jgi:hypothetical protein